MEYLIIDLSKDADGDTVTINEFAIDGWELMQIIVLPGYAAGGVGVAQSSLKALFRKPE